MSVAPPPAALREAAESMARAAGEVLREGHGRAHTPERKGRIDLVTEYDRRAERVLLDEIARRFPGHAVLAEESGASPGRADPDGGTRGGGGTDSVRWLVDPLDGTTNYAHNYPFFCVSVAAEVDGTLAAGAVYDPVRDELFAASAGAGATLNGRPLEVSDIGRVEDALIVTGFPYDRPERGLPMFGAFLTRAQALRRDGSAALNLCYLAAGRFDGFWEGHLSPWDMAAGVLIVREAGGRVTDYAGGTFRLERPEILASNGRIHEEMMAILAGERASR
ncbi:MAG TPA: inositol monophosphatase family protein [Candidatus Eisenbacteria bacterium]|nr:inositol monophosphatase family protein [Candidatus Eisenbacteria bacterium]